MSGARTQQDQQRAAAEYQRAQTEIAKERLQFDRETQAQEFGLKQANLGYSLMGKLADLRGPSNYFQAAEYARNVAGNPNTSTFLSALQNNTRLSGFGAQAGLPDAETGATLAAKLGGGGTSSGSSGTSSSGSGSSGSNDANYMAQIGNIAAKGAGQLAPGSLENLTQTERDLFTSGLDKLGVDKNTFLDQYARSRYGQGFGSSRAA